MSVAGKFGKKDIVFIPGHLKVHVEVGAQDYEDQYKCYDFGLKNRRW